jgi:Icc-related predicted phosphoesterase
VLRTLKTADKFTKVFYATDVHGSDRTFQKFVSCWKSYGVNNLILGGDITGKMVIPIVEKANGEFDSEFLGQKWTGKREDLDDFERRTSVVGYYPYITKEDEKRELDTNPQKLEEVYDRLVVERLQRWIKLAEEKLRDTGVKIYMTGGNDDPHYVEKIIRSSSYVINPQGEAVTLDGKYKMISLADSNPTPWKTPRECSEDDLEKKIEEMVSQVKDVKKCIFNFHVPPKDSTIDTAPKLDASVTPPKYVVESGVQIMEGVGSSAVRKTIEKYQPILGLHGHIHESRGAVRIGRTLCLNPGSEYGEGILRGVIVTLKGDSVKGYQLTSG